jgi:hypothetical protein
MFEFADGADPATKTAMVPRVVAKPQIQPSSMYELQMAQITTPQPPVIQALLAPRCAAVFNAANWDKL